MTTPTAVPFALHNLMTLISNTSDIAVIIMTLFGPKGITPAFSLRLAVNFPSGGATLTLETCFELPYSIECLQCVCAFVTPVKHSLDKFRRKKLRNFE